MEHRTQLTENDLQKDFNNRFTKSVGEKVTNCRSRRPKSKCHYMTLGKSFNPLVLSPMKHRQ